MVKHQQDDFRDKNSKTFPWSPLEDLALAVASIEYNNNNNNETLV